MECSREHGVELGGLGFPNFRVIDGHSETCVGLFDNGWEFSSSIISRVYKLVDTVNGHGHSTGERVLSDFSRINFNNSIDTPSNSADTPSPTPKGY